MRSLGRNQFIVLGACVLIIVLLSFVSTSPSKGKTPMMEETVKGVPIADLMKEERTLLKPDEAAVVASFEGSIGSERDVIHRGVLYDSLIAYLGASEKYILAAHFADEKAQKNSGSGADWTNAGERFRQAASFQDQQDHSKTLYGEAIRCFNKALELDPGNLDAKTGLGIAIVDGTSDPMQGITILREVEAADSTHINMQLALADFAIRSQQYDRAIERYNRVLRMKPEMYALHLSLAEAYDAKGDTAMVVYHLKQYSTLTDDPQMKQMVDDAIKDLSGGSPGEQ